MDRTLSLLITDTARALDKAEDRQTADCRGLRSEAERLTDMLIDVLFPRFAADRASREESLAQAVELLECAQLSTQQETVRKSPLLRKIPVLAKSFP